MLMLQVACKLLHLLDKDTEFGLEEITKGPSSISLNNLGLLVGKSKKSCVGKSWNFFKESDINDVFVTSAPVTDTGNFFVKVKCYRLL